MNDKVRIFVYGTLMVGGSLAFYFNAHRVSCVKAVAPKHELLDLGSFPGMIPGDKHVYGELHEYACPEKVLPGMDRVEGFIKDDEDKSLFVRKVIRVYTEERGENLTAQAYLFNLARISPRTHRKKIEGGKWSR